MIKSILAGAALAALMTVGFGGLASAASNNGPPAGAILDLNGQPITNVQQQYTVDFVAALSDTAITFAFRQDPAFSSFSGVSVTDETTSSTNLLTNGDFSQGVYTNNGNGGTPLGWTYANIYGASDGGTIDNGCGVGGGACWYDGAVQAYDAISQTIATTAGDTYQISFYLNGGSLGSNDGFYSDLSTNGNTSGTGGNGIDVLAYAQAGLPPVSGAPEPATWALMFMGVAFAGGALRMARRNKPALKAA